MTFIKTDVSGAIATHAAIKQNVHGVGANDIADVADISTHAAIKQNVHGVGANDIADVADISTHAAIKQNVHGVGANDIADVADISTHAAVTTNIHGTGAGNIIVGSDELTKYVDFNSITDLSGSRVIGTVYQNTTGHPIFIIISGHNPTGGCAPSCYTDTNNPPTSQVGMQFSGGTGQYGSVCFTVLNNHYYKITGGNINSFIWMETS